MDFVCRSEILLKCKWTIDKFTFRKENTGKFIRSPVFSSHANSEVQWCLRAYPRGKKKECRDYLSVYLEPMTNCRIEYEARSIVSVLDSLEEKLTEHKTFCVPSKSGVWGYDKLVERNILFRFKTVFLPDDKLTLACEVTVPTDCLISTGYSIPITVPQCTLSDDMERLFEEQQLSDFVLSTGDKEYKAHKAILAARSPVFSAMFKNGLEENTSNRVDIADIDGEVLEEMLRYMYTGEAPNLDKMADRLLFASDKYDMKRLKVLCEKSLCDNLAVANAVDALVIADLHGAEVLKAQSIIFISRNMEAITETDGWKKMLFKHELVTEVVRASIKHLDKEK